MSQPLEQIISKCKKNDRKAQFELYHACYDRLMKTCNRFKRNREDAVALLNEGFLKVLLNLDKYDSSQDFFPWISTLMVRTAIDDFRKNQSYTQQTDLKETDAELEAVGTQELGSELLKKLSVEDIKKQIFSLAAEERLVFTLFEMEGYTHKEIAEKLQVTERSTKRYLKRAKDKLRIALQKKSDYKKVI
jgi:RNA polymerase sigma-70 factor (ECF subfamily)